MVGRRSPAVSALEAMYGPCGLFANDVESLLPALAELDDLTRRRRELSLWKDNLLKARMDRSAGVLGTVARRVLDS